jgi:hypothetical protein
MIMGSARPGMAIGDAPGCDDVAGAGPAAQAVRQFGSIAMTAGP